jgi:hypothetical protein
MTAETRLQRNKTPGNSKTLATMLDYDARLRSVLVTPCENMPNG